VTIPRRGTAAPQRPDRSWHDRPHASSTTGARGHADAALPDHSRISPRVPGGGLRSGDPADPRHRRQLHDVEHRAIRARAAVHGDRPRPARPRQVRQAAGGLLGGGVRQRDAGPAQRSRRRAGDRRGAFAGRWRRDAVRLPVPPARRPADPRRRGRRHQGRQRGVAHRRDADGHRSPGPAAATPGAACAAGCGSRRGRAARQDRRGPRHPRHAPHPGRPARADRVVCVRPHTACRRRLARPGGDDAGPLLPHRIRSSTAHLGLTRFGHSRRPRPDGPLGDAGFPTRGVRRFGPLPLPRRPRPVRGGRREVHRLHRTRGVRQDLLRNLLRAGTSEQTITGSVGTRVAVLDAMGADERSAT
jgi:hypothetical protein